MSHIKLHDFVPPAGREWDPGAYPQDGAYRTAVGIFFKSNGILTGYSMFGWEELVTSGAGASSVDVHRLLDQMIELTGPARGGGVPR